MDRDKLDADGINFENLARNLALFARGIQDGIGGLQALAKKMQPFLAELSKSFAILIEGLSATVEALNKLDSVGWLPHATTPSSVLAAADVSALSQAIEQHYSKNWALVKGTFIERLETYTVDEEAKATFCEALAVHGQGHYRAVVRLLFPEIERVTRIELQRFMTQRSDTSQHTLRRIAGELPLGDHGDPLAFRLYLKLCDHLYGHVQDDRAREAVSRDPVPNRHASVHGIVTYSTAQNSINTLIMTDYVFQLVTAVKKRLEKAEAGA